MNKQEYLKILNEAFKDFKFFEDGHYYEFKGQRVGISVTKLIDEYSQEFKANEIAKNVEQLNEWEYKKNFACEKGSTCHEFSQSLWSGNEYNELIFDGSIEYINAVNKIQNQAKQFKKDYEDRLEHLAEEFIIGSEKYNIASAVDHLFINKLTGELVLVDYKTNSYMSGYNKKAYSKKMKVPLNNLNDDSLHHYYIQLSIYKYIIEKYTSLKVSEMFIVYMSENIENYEIIEIPYLKNEVEKILKNRRVKNMNCIPVLIIGKSGSGKSTSLRNFKKDEIAVANVLGKPLPFKTDIEAPKVNDYNIILKSIEKTDKKSIVIDDANYLITNEFMKNSSIKGYDKYNDMANNYWNLINGVKDIEGNKIVYIFMHEDIDEYGNVKPKTIGKLLDDKCNIQGMFTICLRAMYDGSKYIFRTKTNGQDCVKTPIGLFEEEEIENDLKLVDEKIREYYNMK